MNGVVLALCAAGAVAVGWAAAPFVSMARHGTLDQQKRAALRAEIEAAEAEKDARRRADEALPRPRSPGDETASAQRPRTPPAA